MTATRSLSATLQQLNRTLLADEAAELPDAELVARFVRDRDEVAFTALVRRYGLLVFGVCRRVLRHEQDAEDAFQATFLVFARDAARVQRGQAVGNWLYGVAHNVARKARTARHRREAKEHTAAEQRQPEVPPAAPDDLSEILDRELGALPDKYRAPIVLCDLRGLTTQEAAEEVGCPAKTLGTRLSRGRALLARRLTRRGVAHSAGAVAAVLANVASAAAVPPRLVDSTARAAPAFANGSAAVVTPAVAALTTGVTNVMLYSSLKYAVLACAVVAVAALTGGPVLNHIRAAHAPRTAAQPAVSAPAPGTPADTTKPFDANAFHRELYRYVLGQFPWHDTRVSARVDDKKDDKPKPLAGTWAKKDAEVKLTFEKKELKISPHGKDDIILIVCEYTHDKDGLVKAKITGHEGTKKEAIAEKLPVGTEFSFKWKVEKGEATLDELKGEKVEGLKSHLEGTFEEKK